VHWLDLVHSKAAVTGPWHHLQPSLDEYRIAHLQIRNGMCWLYGCLTNLSPDIACDNEKDGVRKYNLALQIAVDDLIELRGEPRLDAALDDSNHMFEVALPVCLKMSRLEEVNDLPYKRLLVQAQSAHLSFTMLAASVGAFASQAASKRFADAFYVRP
jgi:hypothetical protein